MKISELIETLEVVQEYEGDINVYMDTHDGEWPDKVDLTMDVTYTETGARLRVQPAK